MEKNNLKYFLAANSCEGFVSYFADCYNPKDGWKAYIIKGGPGTGKSSFMKYIAAKCAENGEKCELCPCSSDPDSLDAVIIPGRKTVIMDGTAPHTVDPVYPGASDRILNFGEFWRDDLFTKNAPEIIACSDRNKALHKTASLYLQAAGKLLKDNLKTAAAASDDDKIRLFANVLCKRYFRPKGRKAEEMIRFLSGITPKGIVSFAGTVTAQCTELVIIEDNYGYASDKIMNILRERALESGYNIITVKNAFLPGLTDHIIIPELSLAFVRENEYQHFESDTRRIHARRFTNNTLLHRSREKIKFNRKASRELLRSAAGVLRQAKREHDLLEEYYINSMDFQALTKFAEKFVSRIF